MRMRAFQAIVRGKVVSEDAHDRFKVPLYIGNESGGGGALGYQVFSFLSDVHVCFLCRKTRFCPPERILLCAGLQSTSKFLTLSDFLHFSGL